MKTIEQILELTQNPYYSLTNEEQKLYEAFLSKKSGQHSPQTGNSKDSDSSTPVIVKNIVRTEHGQIPTADQVATADSLAEQPATANDTDERSDETEAVEDIVHPDAVK